jgi:hypothetical protein
MQAPNDENPIRVPYGNGTGLVRLGDLPGLKNPFLKLPQIFTKCLHWESDRQVIASGAAGRKVAAPSILLLMLLSS